MTVAFSVWLPGVAPAGAVTGKLLGDGLARADGDRAGPAGVTVQPRGAYRVNRACGIA